MLQAGVIICAAAGGLLLTVLAHTWRLGAAANRHILLTLSLMLAVMFMLQGL